MKTKICLCLAVFALVFGGPALGKDIVLDLNVSIVNQTVEPGKHEVFIDNLTGTCKYEIEVLENFRPIGELSLPEGFEISETRLDLSLGSFTLQRGEELVVEVTRLKESGCEKKEWKFVITTGDRGEWRTTYGFTFVPDRDREYFSRQLEDDPQKFRITEKERQDSGDFLPAVMFTWLSAKHRGRDWSYGPTGGIGADSNNISVLAGYSWTYNENLTFTAGIAIHEESRLEGSFSEGDLINQNLDSGTLNEQVYKPVPYIGVSFRFDANPFPKKGKSKGEVKGDGNRNGEEEDEDDDDDDEDDEDDDGADS